MQIELQSLIPVATFSKGGNVFLTLLLIISVVVALSAVVNLFSRRPLADIFEFAS